MADRFFYCIISPEEMHDDQCGFPCPQFSPMVLPAEYGRSPFPLRPKTPVGTFNTFFSSPASIVM
jgi:hypothetical protein